VALRASATADSINQHLLEMRNSGAWAFEAKSAWRLVWASRYCGINGLRITASLKESNILLLKGEQNIGCSGKFYKGMASMNAIPEAKQVLEECIARELELYAAFVWKHRYNIS
jgi:hypothetical protein